MKKILLATTVCLASANVMAEPKFQVGVGYSMFKSTDSYSRGDFEDSVNTLMLASRYIFSDTFAIEGSYRFKAEDSCTQPNGSACSHGGGTIDVSGADLNLLIGKNLTKTDSVFFYTGVGYFADRWSYSAPKAVNDTINGIQIPFGIGYQFENASLEAQYIYRPSSSYTDSSFDVDATSTTYFGDDLSAGMFSIKLMFIL